MANGRGCRPKVCKDCGALDIDGAVISFRGLCRPCGERRQIDALTQMHEGHGPVHAKWRAGMIETLGLDADQSASG